MAEALSRPVVVGNIDQRVIDLLGLTLEPDTPILLGPTNVEHMKNTHPEDFKNYFNELENILNNPDYVNKNPKDGSIQYIKVIDGHILVGVRISSTGKPFARTIFKMSEEKIEKYENKNLLKKY